MVESDVAASDERADTVSRRRGTLGALAWNLVLEAELVRVLALLEPLEVVAFKGPLLTRQIYGDLRQRSSSDNDLLIRADEADDVLRILRQDGYGAVDYYDPDRTLSDTGRATLVKIANGTVYALDLHVEAFKRPHFEVSTELVRRNLEPMEVHGRTILSFNRRLAFAHLVAHFIQHRFEAYILKDIGAAWALWQDELGGDEYRAFASRTCTVEGFEYAVRAAKALGFSDGPELGVQCRRTNLVLRGFAPGRILEPAHLGYVRGFWATLLVRPDAIPELAWRSLVLPEHELEARHQAEYQPWMRWQRLWGPFSELIARAKRR